MDRLIGLLAALVGLIALGGALLVHNSAEAALARQAAEIAQLKASLELLSREPTAVAPVASAASAPDDGTADTLLAMQNRIAALEQVTRDHSRDLEAARSAIAQQAELPAQPPSAAPSTPTALVADGPTTDCIPVGTRFMVSAGDSFPICKTRAVVSVAGVSEGMAVVDGAGTIATGSSGQLEAPGCTIAVLSADINGFAEMRVTCI